MLLFVPSVKRLRLKIGHKKPTVHLCACYPFDNGTIMKELHAVIPHGGRLRYRSSVTRAPVSTATRDGLVPADRKARAPKQDDAHDGSNILSRLETVCR